MNHKPPIRHRDEIRLRPMLATTQPTRGLDPDSPTRLAAELDRARIMPDTEIPPDIVRRGSTIAVEPVAWARRVNSRWIVHGGLDHTAATYLDYLEHEHPPRLVRSCELAHRLVHSPGEPAEDPKPWFYGGLFCLATAAEAKRFLSQHPFLLAVIPSLASESVIPIWLASAGPGTTRKIERLKAALEDLVRTPS